MLLRARIERTCSSISGPGSRPAPAAPPPLPPPPRCQQQPRQAQASARGSRVAAMAAGTTAAFGAAVAGAALPQQLLQPPQRRQEVRCWSGAGNSGGTGGSGSGGKGGNKNGGERLQNFELLVGDCLCLLCFALYKQITAIIFLPNFPGWLAPLAFNPIRFLEFFSFTATLLGVWVGSGLLTGGYKFAATADLQTAISRTCLMWLVSMPVAASQLVLLTAAEDAALVGDEGFASVLPLAASGPGEPFVTAAGVLGLMCVWRAFYATYLDIFSFGKVASMQRDRQREMEHFADSLRGAMLLSLACCAVLQLLSGLVGEEELELMASSLLGAAFAAGSSSGSL